MILSYSFYSLGAPTFKYRYILCTKWYTFTHLYWTNTMKSNVLTIILTLTVLVTTIDALGYFETG